MGSVLSQQKSSETSYNYNFGKPVYPGSTAAHPSPQDVTKCLPDDREVRGNLYLVSIPTTINTLSCPGSSTEAKWYFCNDMIEYAVEIIVTLGPFATLDTQKLKYAEKIADTDDSYRMVIYPATTLCFGRGDFSGYDFQFIRKRIEQTDYRPVLRKDAWALLKEEAERVADIGRDVAFLEACVAVNLPYVELGRNKQNYQDYAFLRPGNFLTRAELKKKTLIDRVEPSDVATNLIDHDQWHLAAIAALADAADGLKIYSAFGVNGSTSGIANVIPRLSYYNTRNQEEQRLGGYRIHLCINGWWHEKVVDDFLPCAGPMEVFAFNRGHRHELWPSLLEKGLVASTGQTYRKFFGIDAAPAIENAEENGVHDRAMADPSAAPAPVLKPNESPIFAFARLTGCPVHDLSCRLRKLRDAENNAAPEALFNDLRAMVRGGHAAVLRTRPTPHYPSRWLSVVDVKHFHAEGLRGRFYKLRDLRGRSVDLGISGLHPLDARSLDIEEYECLTAAIKLGATADGSFWIRSDALSFFERFDMFQVCYLRSQWIDQRFRGEYTSGGDGGDCSGSKEWQPSLALAIRVAEPTEAFFSFTCEKGAGFDVPAANDDATTFRRGLVLYECTTSINTYHYKPVLSASADPTNPYVVNEQTCNPNDKETAEQRFVVRQAGTIGLQATLDPEKRYLLVPAVDTKDENWATTVSAAGSYPIPYTLGALTNRPLADVRFKRGDKFTPWEDFTDAMQKIDDVKTSCQRKLEGRPAFTRTGVYEMKCQ